MIKYKFYVTTYQSGGEGQGNTHTDIAKDRKTDEPDRTVKHT